MKKFVVMACAVCIVLAGSGQASAFLYNNHDYVVVTNEAISWDNARTAAQALGDGWDLATITSAGEQAFIESLVGPADPNDNKIDEYWLGGFQEPDTNVPLGNWTWVTGEEWGPYTNWAAGEPNDAGGGERYLAIDDRYGWKWNDNTPYLDNIIVGFIAEKVVPEPGTILLLGSGLLGLIGLGRKRFSKK